MYTPEPGRYVVHSTPPRLLPNDDSLLYWSLHADDGPLPCCSLLMMMIHYFAILEPADDGGLFLYWNLLIYDDLVLYNWEAVCRDIINMVTQRVVEWHEGK